LIARGGEKGALARAGLRNRPAHDIRDPQQWFDRASNMFNPDCRAQSFLRAKRVYQLPIELIRRSARLQHDQRDSERLELNAQSLEAQSSPSLAPCFDSPETDHH